MADVARWLSLRLRRCRYCHRKVLPVQTPYGCLGFICGRTSCIRAGLRDLR